MAPVSTGRTSIGKGHRNLLLAASVATFLLITAGSTVCVTGSAMGCPDWPACYGQIVPPMRLDSIIEYTHRIVALLASPLIFAAAFVGWRRTRSLRWVSRPPILAIPFLLAVVVFGALAVLRGLEPGLAALDLGSALIVLALMMVATAAGFYYYRNPDAPRRLSLRTPFSRLVLGTAIAVYLVLVSAVLVAATGSLARCLGWPLYSSVWPTVDSRAWLAILRRVVAGMASFMVLAVMVQAWRTHRGQKGIVTVALSMGILFFAETLLGSLMATFGTLSGLLILYVALVTAVWSLLAVLVLLAGLVAPAPRPSRAEIGQPAQRAL
jgi:cytochrome c oxidase assembly protein subunit 15